MSLRRLGALSLSVIQTTLVFVGVPVAVVGIVFAVVFAGGARRGNKRYRPGRPFEFRPVWFLSAPEQSAPGQSALEATGVPGPGAGATRAALPVGQTGTTVTGGASDTW